MNDRRLDASRNSRIMALLKRGTSRKLIAFREQMSYQAVKKVIQRYYGPERRRFPRPQIVRKEIRIDLV